MAINLVDVKKWIDALGFCPAEGEMDVYHKTYTQHDGYTLLVDFSEKALNMPMPLWTRQDGLLFGVKRPAILQNQKTWLF